MIGEPAPVLDISHRSAGGIMSEPVDVVGIGVGPANLSLAALLDPHSSIRSRFFERTLQFQWHPGLMFPEAVIQVPFVKDLVTLVDPTSRFSFLSFLSQANRLYHFVNASFPQVLRREFSEYYAWASSQLRSVDFSFDVGAVTYEGSDLVVHTKGVMQRTRHLVLGTGLSPSVPECAVSKLGPSVFHASEYRSQNLVVSSKRVVVVGGGQTGAEVVQHLLSNTEALPAAVHWISRRSNFLPLDETPFTNELFTPTYSDHFFKLPLNDRLRLLDEQRLASEGISPSLLRAIYRRLYELWYCDQGRCDWSLRPGRELIGLSRNHNGWVIAMRHALTGAIEVLYGDVVVLCTGYHKALPSYLDPIRNRLCIDDGRFAVEADFSIVWDGPLDRKIYVQNSARAQRGIADPNLSLVAWRSAKIANGIAGRQLYNVQPTRSFVSWDCDVPTAEQQLTEHSRANIRANA